MKRTLLAASLSFIVAGTFAQLAKPVTQKAVIPAQVANIVKTMRCPAYNNAVVTDPASTQAAVSKSNNKNKTMANSQAFIGITNYQLQTNSSTRDALIKHADGTMSTVWTQLYTGQNTALRGTGYNYYNGSAWAATPTTRIENARTGWPSIGVTASGKEFVVAHNTTANQLHLSYRAAKGTGAWTQTTSALTGPSTGGNVWPRIATGGSDGNTIHILSITAPTGLGGVKYNKQNGCLTYCRSTDDGATWDKLHYLNTFHDSTAGYTYIGGDSYAMDAKGTTVAYVVGSPTTDLILVKSTDNGNTWTKTTILDFPIDFYFDQITDVDGNPGVDTIMVNDGVYSIALDNAGNAHVAYSTYTMFNDNTTDSTYSYFPYSSDLRYWNESLATDSSEIIGFLADLDGNMTYDIPTGNPNSGTYNTGAVSHPSIAVDASNKVFVAFDEVCDANDDGNGKAFRNIFVTGSPDGGLTWSGIIRVSGPVDGQGFEQVYASAAKRVDNCFSFVFQQDAAAGHGVSSASVVSPDETANQGVDADIVFNCFDVADIVAVTELSNKDFFVSDLYPNPFGNQTTLSLSVNKTSNISIDIFNTAGAKVRTIAGKNYTSGSHNVSIDKGTLAPGLYLLTLRSGESVTTKRLIVE